MRPKFLAIQKNILDENGRRASKLREQFERHGTKVINIVSSPGSGKTELLTVLSKNLIDRHVRVSIIVGDVATDNDAKRLEKSGALTHQIITNGNCHLDANMIQKSMNYVDWKHADILFIENVGNLVCPAGFDLGESLRVVLLSVTEGEDKPSKYPAMFHSADICIITKMDLADAVEFNEQLAIQNIRNVNPTIQIVKTSAKKHIGIEDLIQKFQSQ